MAGSRIPDPADPYSGYGNPCKADPTGYLYLCGCFSGECRRNCDTPVLAGAYSSALVPIGILMALLGNIIGTAGRVICRILNEPDRVENNN